MNQIERHIQAHVQAINACNQRGGRMLSLIDLIEAQTVDLELGAYLAAAMRSGASLLVGARPGGAGKTTVMCALLNFLPNHTAIQPIDRPSTLTIDKDSRVGEICYLAHEIGNGPYYAYVWGEQARRFFHLASLGHIVASNLHADTLEETRQQLVQQNGVAPSDLQAVHLQIYLRVQRSRGWSVKRRTSHVYESNGSSTQLIWQRDEKDELVRQAPSHLVSAGAENEYQDLIAHLLAQKVRRIEQIRRTLLDHDRDPAL